MNETERAALVDILKTFYGEARYTGTTVITEDARHTRRAIAAIRDLLATRAPAPDDDAVERAARAIAEMYPPRRNKRDGYINPVWDMIDIEDVARAALVAGTAPEEQGDE